MFECTVDTHILAEIMMQYSPSTPKAVLVETEFLTDKVVNKINEAISTDGFSGTIIASAFAFVEIINQMERVSKNKFDVSRVIGFLKQPPEWFIVEPYSHDTVKIMVSVPKFNLRNENVELADAIHVATAMQRGPGTFLATMDGVLTRLSYRNLGIVHLF
jgi:predicted nucleic acid-binding protein